MIAGLQRMLLVAFGRLPRGLRRRLVRLATPSYTVGALCVIEHPDGRLLLIRHRYRDRWGLPGGLLSRREAPAQAVVREVREEVCLDLELLGEPAVVVEPVLRRVDVVFRARPRDAAGLESPGPCSEEVVEARWFALEALPPLQEETTSALLAVARSRTGRLLEPPEGRGH